MTQQLDLETFLSPPDVNRIFKEYSVVEVEKISENLSERAATLHGDLQNLVSLKYRDLLKTSDLIIDMNIVSKTQDEELYELSFLKNPKVDKLFRIERNIEELGRDIDDSQTVDLYANQRKVLENNENFLKLSNFLHIDETLGNNLEIIEMVNDNLTLPITTDSWFYSHKTLILKKFERLEKTIVENISSNFKVWEVLKVYKSLKQLTLFEELDEGINIDKVEQKIFQNIIKLIDHDFKDELTSSSENLDQIIKEFSNFKERILKNYITSISLIDLSLPVIEKDDVKLNLYKLNFNDDDYLLNVKNLNNGLHYTKYQALNDNILSFIKILNILKTLDTDEYKSQKTLLLGCIGKFKEIASAEKNNLLLRYLNMLIQQIDNR